MEQLNECLESYVDQIKKIYGKHLKTVILYGSYARGDFKPASDIDIMILLDITELDIKKIANSLSDVTFDFNMEHDVDIKPIAKDIFQFYKWVDVYPFYKNIQQEGVVLYGASCMQLQWEI